MEKMTRQIDGGKFGIGDFHALGVFVLIQFGADGESGGSCGGRDQLNNRLKAAQGLSAPIEGDEGKEAMFDLVPLAGPGRQMANSDGNTHRIREILQFYFPQTNPVAITAPTIGGNQKARGLGIALVSQGPPPASDRVDRETGSVVIGTHANPALVITDIVDPVRNGA